jgi:hypothetical protein
MHCRADRMVRSANGTGYRHPCSVSQLQDLGMSAAESVDGDTLVHSDLRDDNVILADTDEIWVCDWNWPTHGPIWVDTLTVTIGMVGDGLDGDRILNESGLVASTDANLIDGVLALLLSYCMTADTGSPTPHRSSGRTTPGTRQ